MYAIIKAGGKQYTVKPGDVLRVEKLDAELGAELALKDVLMIGGDKTFIGTNAEKAIVTVVVTNQQRAAKVIVFKKKRRQGYRRMGGHRQPYTELFIKSITNPEGQTANADTKPQVFDPEKKAMKLAKSEDIRQAKKEAARKAGAAGEPAAPKAQAAAGKKKVAKKAAGKSAGVKKAGGKKKAGAKKVAKKSATTKKKA